MDEYTLEEIELTEDFSRHIVNWYKENFIVEHSLSRADFVRANNQRIQAIFDDLKHLLYYLEERNHTQAINLWRSLDSEAKEIIPENVIEHINTIQPESIQEEDDF